MTIVHEKNSTIGYDTVNKCVANGTYFFDYGNAFLLEASRG